MLPSAHEITTNAGSLANTLAPLAIAWHVAAAAALVAVLAGWRPSHRLVLFALAAPIVTVSAVAFASHNPVTGTTFLVLAIVLAVAGEASTAPHVRRGHAWSTWFGAVLLLYALCYPHFVTGAWWRVIVAAPVGVLPCPTLALVAGFVMLAGGFGSRGIPAVLAVWAGLYAYVGVAWLGVALDLGLLVASLALLALAVDHGAGEHAALGT